MAWKCYTLPVVVTVLGKAIRRALRKKIGMSHGAARVIWRGIQTTVCVLIPGALGLPPLLDHVWPTLPPWSSVGPSVVPYSSSLERYNSVAIPEPETLLLLGAFVFGFLVWRNLSTSRTAYRRQDIGLAPQDQPICVCR